MALCHRARLPDRRGRPEHQPGVRSRHPDHRGAGPLHVEQGAASGGVRAAELSGRYNPGDQRGAECLDGELLIEQLASRSLAPLGMTSTRGIDYMSRLALTLTTLMAAGSPLAAQ